MTESDWESWMQEWRGTTTEPLGPVTRIERAWRSDGSNGRDGFGCGGKGRMEIEVDAGRSSGVDPTWEWRTMVRWLVDAIRGVAAAAVREEERSSPPT